MFAKHFAQLSVLPDKISCENLPLRRTFEIFAGLWNKTMVALLNGVILGVQYKHTSYHTYQSWSVPKEYTCSFQEAHSKGTLVIHFCPLWDIHLNGWFFKL